MALLHRKQVVAVVVEGAEGTAETPANADAGFNTFETSFSPEVEQYERNPFRSSLGRLASIAGVKTGTVGFMTELVGSGNHAPGGTALPFHTLMLACGYERVSLDTVTVTATTNAQFIAGETITAFGSETAICGMSSRVGDTTIYVVTVGNGLTSTSVALTGSISNNSQGDASAVDADVAIMYKPLSTEGSSYTVGVFNDGIRHRIQGARGNVSFAGSTGQPVKMSFEFTGPFKDSTDTGLLTPTYPARVPPAMLNANLSAHTDLLIVDSFEIATGNELSVRRSANDPAGAISTKITQRSMSGSIDPEVETILNHNFIEKMTNNDEGLLDLTIGSTTGNRFRLQGPNCSYAGVSGGERGGISTYSMDLSLNETSVGDNDFRLLCF
ncbi:MAG: hypothetical protein ABGY10_01935 [bacterium]